MRFFLISDNNDTRLGMRLTGIEGVVVHEPDEVNRALSDAMQQEDIAVILMTEQLVKLCGPLVDDLKLHRARPLIVEIPDRTEAAAPRIPSPVTCVRLSASRSDRRKA